MGRSGYWNRLRSIISTDEPDHTPERRLMLPFFAPKAVEKYREHTRDLCRQLIRGFVNARPIGIQRAEGVLELSPPGDTRLRPGDRIVVIAGDPMSNAGQNLCGQPQSCGAPVQAFHAERLYEFAELQEGMNGFTANICSGPSAVPDAVEAALSDNIDLACQDFEPVG